MRGDFSSSSSSCEHEEDFDGGASGALAYLMMVMMRCYDYWRGLLRDDAQSAAAESEWSSAGL